MTRSNQKSCLFVYDEVCKLLISEAMIGLPAAAVSRATSPNGSGQIEGTTAKGSDAPSPSQARAARDQA